MNILIVYIFQDQIVQVAQIFSHFMMIINYIVNKLVKQHSYIVIIKALQGIAKVDNVMIMV